MADHKEYCPVERNHETVYHSGPDAYWCISCKKWITEKCDDAECKYCAQLDGPPPAKASTPHEI